MRDILNLIAQLNESTGLAGRKPGDVFRNPQGEEIVFNDIKFFPAEGGKYDQPQLELAVQQVEQQDADIHWQNNRTPRMGGFALASFTGKNGEFFVGRYLESIKPSATENYVPNAIGEYRFSGKAAAKAQAGLSPQDLLTDKIDLTVPMIMNQLAQSMGTDNPLYAVAHRIAMGEPLPFSFPAPADVSFSAFRDYFCEILQPIAMQKGQYTGNAGEAAEKFLGGSFSNTVISFDDSKTAGLSDSIMTNPEGKSVKISSKGGKGATASSKNLIDSVDELEKTPEGKKFLKPYDEIVEMLREIQFQGQAGAPLYLGVLYDIITEEDAQSIEKLKNQPLMNLNDIKSTSLSSTVKKLALNRKSDNPEKTNLYYHLIAAVAHEAAEQVNEQTNFSKAAADILNNGALVQVYTKAKQNQNTWELGEFDTVYPGDTIKGVYLSASKTYYSTGIKGNFTFKIDKGAGKPKEQENTKIAHTDFDDSDFIQGAEDVISVKKKPKEVEIRQKRK